MARVAKVAEAPEVTGLFRICLYSFVFVFLRFFYVFFYVFTVCLFLL